MSGDFIVKYSTFSLVQEEVCCSCGKFCKLEKVVLTAWFDMPHQRIREVGIISIRNNLIILFKNRKFLSKGLWYFILSLKVKPFTSLHNYIPFNHFKRILLSIIYFPSCFFYKNFIVNLI